MVNTVESGETPKSNGINNGSSNNGAGPRVSFNRDVHVKRYGTQLNHNDHLNSSFESLPTQTQTSAKFHRELPTDLSEEALEREAALVLEQANYFGQSNTSSLPSRKNRRGPVRRSISDASAAAKKTKRNSIFNIFNTNSNTTNTSAVNKKPTNLSEKHAKKVERSKSDVSSRSSSQGSKRDKYRNSIHLNTNNSYNNKTNNYNNSESFLQPVTSTPKKIPLTPITEVNSPSSDVNNRSDYFDGLVEATKANKAKLISRGNIGYTSREDLDLIPSTDNMKSKHSKSLDAMHCSQMPADKPTLTKGAAVDTMIKRLSIERFSPPPVQVIGVGGFSYTNPHNTTTPTSPTTILTTVNPSLVITPTKHKSLSPPLTTLKSDKDIVYAQVVCNDLKNVNGNKIHSKETVHNTIPRKNRHSASPPPNIKTQFQKPISHNNDFVIATASSPIPENGNYRNSVKIIRENYPDNGYGNGRDDIDGNNIGITTYGDEEPIIKPNIRYHIPRYLTTTTITNNNNYNSNNHHDNHNTSNNNNNHQYNHNNNEFNNNNYEMRDTDYNVDISLSNRREILESRIKSRIGGLHTINNDNNNVIINRIQNTSSSPPTTKRYHKYGSNEIVNRYSPERTHLDFIQPTATVSQQQQQKHYQEDYTDNNTLRKKSYHYNKTHDKVDSGIEVDSVIKSNGKKKPSYISRFKIGRKWNHKDDIIECELFLMKEKKHTEETYPFQLVKTYVYRERSIDDGSHYDPNIDKLNIMKDIKKNNKIAKDFLQSKKKKKSGMEKVKELFKSKSKSPTDVDDNDVRSRYREYSPNPEPPSQVVTVNAHQEYIANRRRLSTPTSSPVTNRSVSLPPKSKKISSQMTTSTSTLKRDKENGNQAQKFSWFTSLDRSKKKVKDPAAETANRKYFTMNKATSLKNISAQSANSGSNKTLRFFGDTDADDVESISKAKGKKMTAFQEARLKSTSMQNLNPSRKAKQNKSVSRSRVELQNISESTSDTEFNEFPIRRPASPIIVKNLPPPRPPKTITKTTSTSSTTLPRPPRRKMFDEDEVDREYMHRDVQESSPFYQKKESFESDSLANLTSARKLKESMSASRENMQRDRFDSDASLRSVVYLHATTVGDIPSQTLGRSKVSGRNSVKTAIQENQPMTRTVNRSVSLNAPWKPKLISDGYEINYNNEQQKGKYHQNNLRSKSASREKLTERSRSRNEKRSDSSKRI